MKQKHKKSSMSRRRLLKKIIAGVSHSADRRPRSIITNYPHVPAIRTRATESDKEANEPEMRNRKHASTFEQ